MNYCCYDVCFIWVKPEYGVSYNSSYNSNSNQSNKTLLILIRVYKVNECFLHAVCYNIEKLSHLPSWVLRKRVGGNSKEADFMAHPKVFVTPSKHQSLRL